VGELVERLRHLYPSLEAWQPARPSNPLARLAARYGLSPEVALITDLPALLAACARGERREPFWVVARRRSQV
jgi:hypothetical protein